MTRTHVVACLAVWLAWTSVSHADVRVPNLFTSHMVLQRDLANPVWGMADPGEAISVSLGDQRVSTTAGADGRWRVKLAPLAAGGPHTLTIQGNNKLVLEDVLVGEVWVCSGQSNMQWAVAQANDADLEIKTAKFPNIRLITVPQVGSQEPQFNFQGEWKVCSPETVGDFSAVGYFFGRMLHRTLDVPVGLIDNSWGGSACEAWVDRKVLQSEGKYSELLAKWEQIEQGYDKAKADAQHEQAMAAWKKQADEAKAAGKPIPRAPQHPGNQLAGNHRPGNLYNGVLHPVIGYGIRGAIWYQGESNAGRAYQYRELFPLMIQRWRTDWAQGDFPFYWVQLADFLAEKPEPAESSWAELREAQTLTMSKLPNTGEAVIIDIGEANDIHPRNKLDVAHRLARWALAKDYGVSIPYRSPTFRELKVDGNKAVLQFDFAGSGLKAHDSSSVLGFAVAGEDKKFVWAKAEITGPDQITVSAPGVDRPVAVRYAWADNPVCNVRSRDGLPMTPFRTDDWPGITAGVNK